ncbi:MAG: ABC transporter substrate-binding protein [Actinomycetaceae bacterium]|nr:ABC transporter substrate-binding protein [Actinomycetaceae bacterium]
MFRTTIRPIALATIGAIAIPLTACSTVDSPTNESAASVPSTRSTVVVASGESEPSCLDPHVGGNWPQALIGTQVLESLFSRDSDGNVIPWLAEKAEESDDGMTVTVFLKEGITFSDGTPFNADAVVANVEHLRNPETKSSTGVLALAKVAQAVAVDEHTVRFEMNEPDSALPASLAQTWLAMMSPAGLERGFEANCAEPIGTGPFTFESWTKQDRVVLKKNPTFVDADEVAIEEIQWRFVPDASARVAALRSGEADLIDQVQPLDLKQLDASGEGVMVLGPRPGTTARIELNTTAPVFNDERVREAFALSANIDEGVENLFGGIITRSTSPLASTLPERHEFPDAFPYDPQRAAQLLDDAGWSERDENGTRMKDGQALTVRFPISTNQSIPAEISLVEQIASGASEVGFKVMIEPLDISNWYQRAGEWSFDAIIAPYSKSSADVLRIVYHSDGNIPAPSGYHANNTGLELPDLDALVDEAGRSADAQTRRELYAQAQQMIIDSHAVIPLYDQTGMFARSPQLEGFTLRENLYIPDFTGAKITQ